MGTERNLYLKDSREISPKKIWVSDYAFKNLNENEFYSMLVRHEGKHATQKGFNIETEKYVDFIEDGKLQRYFKTEIIEEIEALESQINHPSFSMCSEEFQKDVQHWLSHYKHLSNSFRF